MVRIAAAWGERRSQTPNAWKMRRLTLPNAVVRSLKPGGCDDPGAVPSTSSAVTPLPANARARQAPTIPPPMMATSTGVTDIGRTARGHDGLNGLHRLGSVGSQHFDAVPGHHDV